MGKEYTRTLNNTSYVDKKLSKKSSKKSSKRGNMEAFAEFRRLIDYLTKQINDSDVKRKDVMSLAKKIRDEVKKSNPNGTYKQLTDSSIDLFNKNKSKYVNMVKNK